MRRKTKNRNFILWMVLFIPYICVAVGAAWYWKKLQDVDNASFIIINKAEMTLYLYNYKGKLLQKSKVATGKNFGNKTTVGDLKTPEGVFRISAIQNASSWKHDFEDDSLGEITGAYGPYFIRLEVPGQKGIGIHGTHDDSSIGNRVSEGCIRMNNKDLEELVTKVKKSSVVVITPGIEDPKSIESIISAKPKEIKSIVIITKQSNPNVKVLHVNDTKKKYIKVVSRN